MNIRCLRLGYILFHRCLSCMFNVSYPSLTWLRKLVEYIHDAARQNQALAADPRHVKCGFFDMSKVGSWRNQSAKSSVFQYFHNRYHEIVLKGVIMSIFMQAPY